MPTHHYDLPDRPENDDEPKRLETDGLPINPYDVLGLDPTATDAEVKQAYFQKVREHPPERDPQQFKRVRAAYDALRTPEARAATDLFMLHLPTDYETYKRAPTLTTDYTSFDWDTLLRAGTDLDRDDFSGDFRDVDL
jgi:curved DNA-binding protein CbpA